MLQTSRSRNSVEDTLPDGFDAAKITSVMIEEEPLEQFENTTFPVTIPWAADEGEGGWKNLYDTGARITIDYMAVLNDKAVIDGEGNKNSADFHGIIRQRNREKAR